MSEAHEIMGFFSFPFEHQNHRSWFNDSRITTVQLVRVTLLAAKDMLFYKKHKQQEGEVRICYFQHLYAERYLQYFISWFPHGAFTLFGEVVKNRKQRISSERRMKRKLSFSLDFGQIIFSASDLH